jgi:hypothetical protein
MLDAGVKPGELGELVERFIAVASDQLFKHALDLDDIDQVTVRIQLVTVQPQLDLGVVRVQVVFGSPITAGQLVPGNEIVLRQLHTC